MSRMRYFALVVLRWLRDTIAALLVGVFIFAITIVIVAGVLWPVMKVVAVWKIIF